MYIDIMDKKKIGIIALIFIVAIVFFGGTYAYLRWESSDRIVIDFTPKGFSCEADGESVVDSSDIVMMPTDCTNSEHAVKRKVTVSSNAFDSDAYVYMDFWLGIDSLDAELSQSKNLRYAVTTSENSCTENVIVSGSFYGKEAMVKNASGEVTNSDKSMITILDSDLRSAGIDQEELYFYIWLDKEETNPNTAGKSFQFSLSGKCESDEIIREDISITSTNNALDTQTVSFKAANSEDIVSYYYGTSNPETQTVNWVNVSSNFVDSVSVSLNSSGTYYFGFKDSSGIVTSTSKKFYMTTLELYTSLEGGTTTQTKILSMEGNTITLPTPTLDGDMDFDGWYENGSTTPLLVYTPTADTTLTGEAHVSDITGVVTIKGTNTYKETLTVEHVIEPTPDSYQYEWYFTSSTGTVSKLSSTTTSYTIDSGRIGGTISVNVIAVYGTDKKIFTDVTDTINNETATVSKFNSTLAVSTNSISLNYPENTTATYTYDGEGTVTCSSSNTNVVIVSCTGGTLTVESVGYGDANITVTATDNTNIEVPSSKVIPVTVKLPTYVITYNPNGGSGEPLYQTKTFGESITLSTVKPTREGYTFLGWSTNSSSTSATYSSGQTYTSNSDILLYAIWGIPTAIYSATDKSLNFYIANEGIQAGDTYNGNVVTAKYTDFEDQNYSSASSVPWYSYRSSVTSVSVVDEISPINTGYWFNEFSSCSNFDLADLDTSNVTNMSYMFYSAYGPTSVNFDGLSNWDTSKVTDMSYMFMYTGTDANAFSWSIDDISDWNTSNVTNMSNMFNGAGYGSTSFYLGDLSGWDTSKVTDMSYMFDYAGGDATNWNISGFEKWDTSNVTDMSYMFSSLGGNDSSSFELDLSGWDTSKVTDMSYMFSSLGRNDSSSFELDLSGWDTSNVTNMRWMFNWGGRNASSWNIIGLNGWDTSKVTDMSYMFNWGGGNDINWSISDLGINNWDTSNVTNMSHMFDYAGYNSTKGLNLNFGSWDVSNVTNMSYMFSSSGYNASSWNISGLSSWDVSKVTDMSAMFYNAGYKSGNYFALDLTGWDTSKVTNMSSMFYNAGYSASSWNISGLGEWKNTSNVTNMRWMFYRAGYTDSTWTLDLSGWDVSKVTSHSDFSTAVGGTLVQPIWVN